MNIRNNNNTNNQYIKHLEIEEIIKTVESILKEYSYYVERVKNSEKKIYLMNEYESDCSLNTHQIINKYTNKIIKLQEFLNHNANANSDKDLKLIIFVFDEMELYWNRVIEGLTMKLEREMINDMEYTRKVNMFRHPIKRIKHSKELVEGQLLLKELGV